MSALAAARKAALPSGVSLMAWRGLPPPLCSAKVDVEAQTAVKLLPSSSPSASDGSTEAQTFRQRPEKSFKMNIGAYLSIPTKNAKERPQYSHPLTAQEQQDGATGVYDPFEGLPFRAFAERMGTKVMPVMQAAREAERSHKVASRRAAEQAEVVVPLVPHVLPFTRWAASSTKFRSTFIADPPKERKKARLSWYHPDDTMVPRDWFQGGLMEDLKYYMPFGLGSGSSAAAAEPAPAQA